MIELTNREAQTVLPGGYVTFDRVKLHTKSSCECFSEQVPTSVKLCARGIYNLQFSGNGTSSAADTQLQVSIAVAGTPLVNTAMDAKPAAAGDLWNISGGTFFENCCCDADRISVMNTGAAPLVLAPNSSLRIIREA